MYTFVKGVLLVSNPTLPVALLEYKDSQFVELSAINCGDIITRSGLSSEWIATFVVSNGGTTNLSISSITLSDMTSGIEVSASQPDLTSLYPGQSAQFDVTFQPHETITHVEGSVNIPTNANPNCSVGFVLDYINTANDWEIGDIPNNGSGYVPLLSSVNLLNSTDLGGGLRSYNLEVTNNGPATVFPEATFEIISQPVGGGLTMDVTKIYEGTTEPGGFQVWNIGLTGGIETGTYVIAVTIPGHIEVQLTIDFTLWV
jgi:uncharacterized cupredoxin-like copper-binding protein